MITAMDNLGGIYVSLLQANSDSDTMRLFILEFIKLLDAEDRNWRGKTTIFWDGAGYHRSKEVVQMLES